MKPTPEEVAEMLNIVGKEFDNIMGREITARRFRAMSATVSELIAENNRLKAICERVNPFVPQENKMP